MKKLSIALGVLAIALAGTGIGSADEQAETSLTGAPIIKVDEPGNLEFRAELSTADGPVAGATIIFRVPAEVLCEATTDEDGIARGCEDPAKLVPALQANFYDIVFEGTRDLAPSSTRAGLVGSAG